MENPLAPLTVVFAGPTGAGKSTLLNSVAGAEHSVAGPLRPTTKSPLVLAARDLASGYSTIGGIQCQVVTGRAPILDELTLVDTPDIDSTSIEHRVIAETMIDYADVVVYVNSAQRYADLVPWEVLRRAHSRGAPVIHVLNRIKSSSSGALADYATRLQTEGLGSDVVAVHEHRMPRGAQAVPLVTIQGLRDRLVEVVEERLAGRVDVVMSVLDTTLDQADEMLSEVAGMTHGVLSGASRRGLTVDLGRILSTLGPVPAGAPNVGPLAGLSGKRLITRGRVRRSLPTPSSVARSQILLDASLVAAIDSDIRAGLRSTSLLEPGQTEDLVGRTHVSAMSAITGWHRDLDGMRSVQGAIDPSLAAYLLAKAVLHGQGPGEEEAMQVLAGIAELTGPLTRARELLETQLIPVYARFDHEVASRAGESVASDAAIYRARTSLSAVVARSSFANA